ncbi:glycosyltransferase family 4 protein [Pedobacter sp.]|uniref:glycosyltransferase family 4 protein n=1 Tax=Pedobacter sp. TaxID=1411316 RepID=UPI003D7FB45F
MIQSSTKVLFLTLTMFGDTGGIQKVCRTLSMSLSKLCPPPAHFQVFSLGDHPSHLDARYLAINTFKGFSYQRLRFCIHSIRQSIRAKVVILSHINLLPIAWLIKLINPKTQIIVLAHGIEVWRPVSWWKIAFLKKHCQLWSVSHFTANKIREQHGLHGKNVYVLPNCLDPFFEPPHIFRRPSFLLERYNIKSESLILLSICRLTVHEQDKGYDQVLNAMPSLLQANPNICYLLAGKADTIEMARLKDLIIAKKLQEHVLLVGYIDDEELSSHYLLADIFILVSKKEGFGLVFLEAAACGCKIICGNVDGSSEAVLNGRIGTQVEPNSNRQLVHAILATLQKEHDDVRAKYLQKTCMEHFSFPSYHDKVKQLLTPFINKI